MQYERFRAERAQPFHDLLGLLEPVPGGRVVDLGCGTGALTGLLHERMGAASTLGVDRSLRMLRDARQATPVGLSFLAADLARLPVASEERFDVVFSNAALHWVDDHPALLAALAARLTPGGQLAVQVPDNDGYATHVVAAELAAEEPHRTELGGHVRRTPVLAPGAYRELLRGLGLLDVRVRLEVYTHLLDGPADVVEWVRGTLLTDYEQRLAPESFERFLVAYRERLLAVLPSPEPGTPFVYPFRRILLCATRPPIPIGPSGPSGPIGPPGPSGPPGP